MARFWRHCRTGFRWFRLTVWLLVLALVCALAWFDKVGLPDFLKSRLRDTIRAQGVDVDFTRLRLRVLRGLVAENIQVRPVTATNSVALTLGEAQLHLDWPGMLHGHLRVGGLELHDGHLAWQPTETTAIDVTNLELHLALGTDDTWTLERCSAIVNGLHVNLSGEIRHAPSVLQWSWPAHQPGASPDLALRLDQAVALWRQVQFATPPDLSFTVRGDATDLSSFDLRLILQVPAAQTPWGNLRQLALTAEAWPARFDTWPRAEIHLTAAAAAHADWHLRAAAFTLTSPVTPLAQRPPLDLRVTADQFAGPPGSAHQLRFNAQLAGSNHTPVPAETNAAAGFWNRLAPFPLSWSAQADAVHTPKLSAQAVAVSGSWQFPRLAVDTLSAQLNPGSVNLAADLDVSSRAFRFTNDSSFDPHLLAPWLRPSTRARLDTITWHQPPVLHGEGRLTLPPWDAPAEDAAAGIASSLELGGTLAFTNAEAGSLPLDTVATRFHYTRQSWELSDLSLTSGRTALALDLAGQEPSRDYTATVAGRFAPETFRALLTSTNALHAFQICELTEPLALSAQVHGNLANLATLTADGQLALTNFAIRGQWVDQVTGGFHYADRVIRFSQPRLSRAGGAQHLAADEISLDTLRRRLEFVHGYGIADPQALTRAIGPKTARTIAPYQFLVPPEARVNGYLILPEPGPDHDVSEADLNFEVLRPVPFRWQRLSTPQLQGNIHWLGKVLVLTNLSARFYEGDAQGWASFDFRPRSHDADYRFAVNLTNVDLHLLACDFNSPTNRLAGRLSGWLAVTNASTDSLNTWNGSGHLILRDGLIWDIPVFGIISPLLNSISPGLGDNRATEADADFVLTNGVFATDPLLIRTTMSRMEYRGTVDLHQHVDAKVTLELLRNTPVVGFFISSALRPVSKAFAYHVTGSLSNPHTTPVYVPEIFLLPLHPFHTLEDIFSSSSDTNKPPATPKPAR